MKRPPLGVIILGVLILIVGLILTVVGALALFVDIASATGHLPVGWQGLVERVEVLDALIVAAQFALGVAALVSGVGVLLLRTWAWLMALALLGCELVIELSNYFQGRPVYWAMFLSALLVLYLNQRPIREAFNIVPKRTALPSSMHMEPVGSDSGAETLITDRQKP